MKSVLDPGNTGNSVLDGKDASKFGSNSGSSGGSSPSSAGDEGSSGGGSFGWLSLLQLAFAAMQRRRKAKSSHGRGPSHCARAETGRASCRERGCTYGEISVGDGRV